MTNKSQCSVMRSVTASGQISIKALYNCVVCMLAGFVPMTAGSLLLSHAESLQSVNLRGIGKERCSEGHTEYTRDLLSTCIIIKGGTATMITRIRRKKRAVVAVPVV